MAVVGAPAVPPPDVQARTRVLGRRVVALLIDSLAWGAILSAVFLALAQKTATSAIALDAVSARLSTGDTTYVITGGRAQLFYLLWLALGACYWVVPTALTGMTLGKLITGIRVVGPDWERSPGVGRALVRQLFWVVDDFPFAIPALTGFIVALSTPNRTRVGDIVARTLVVRRAAG